MKSLCTLSTIPLLAAMLGCESPLSHARGQHFAPYAVGSLVHPLQKPDGSSWPQHCSGTATSCDREHVYIFVINGLDPLCLGNLNGLCDYLVEEGFCNTYFSQLHTCAAFAQGIRQVRQEDPRARIVVIGYSCGCNCARHLVNTLCKDSTNVDLLVYLGGDMIDNSKRSFPENVCRVVNIRARGLILSGGDLFLNCADIDGARNCKVDARHILAPSRKETVELLMEELLALACGPPAAQPRPETQGPATMVSPWRAWSGRPWGE
jgi:hypothetical protein